MQNEQLMSTFAYNYFSFTPRTTLTATHGFCCRALRFEDPASKWSPSLLSTSLHSGWGPAHSQAPLWHRPRSRNHEKRSEDVRWRGATFRSLGPHKRPTWPQASRFEDVLSGKERKWGVSEATNHSARNLPAGSVRPIKMCWGVRPV